MQRKFWDSTCAIKMTIRLPTKMFKTHAKRCAKKKLLQYRSLLMVKNQKANSFTVYSFLNHFTLYIKICWSAKKQKKNDVDDQRWSMPRSLSALQDSIQRFVQRRSVHNLGGLVKSVVFGLLVPQQEFRTKNITSITIIQKKQHHQNKSK